MRLSRDDVLARALALLDEVGLEALTMRRLAAALGVQPGAIYWHFANKQALEDAMAEAMMVGLLEPDLEGTWDEQLAELSRRLRTALCRHRDGASLAVRAVMPGPAGLAVSERMLRILRDAGFSKRATLWATAVLGYYILGYVTELQGTERTRVHGLTSVAQAFMRQLDAKQYPNVAMVANIDFDQYLTPRAANERFDYGLRVILTGLAATLPPRRPRARKARKAPRARMR
jgi:TetR/AcrR family tetracycline transcriptional repressor